MVMASSISAEPSTRAEKVRLVQGIGAAVMANLMFEEEKEGVTH
jgi:hypothetical protein